MNTRDIVLLAVSCASLLGCEGRIVSAHESSSGARGHGGAASTVSAPNESDEDDPSGDEGTDVNESTDHDPGASDETGSAETDLGPCDDVPVSCDPTKSPISPERRIVWKPGIPGGVPRISDVCARIDVAAYGDGSQDATTAIQDAIDACPEGQAVVLPAGTYRTTRMLRIEKGIVLRGEGPGSSELVLDDSRVSAVVRVGREGRLTHAVAIIAGMEKGSTRVTVADSSQYEVGDVILIDQKDDPALVATGDCQWFKRTLDGARSLGQTVQITAIDGDSLTLSSPLYYNYRSDFDPQITKPADGTTFRAGVEDLYLTRKSDYGGQGSIIELFYTAESWVQNVETEKVSGRHIMVTGSYRNVIRDSYSHHAWDYNPGAHAYGISLNSETSDTLVENNVVYYLNIPVVFENSGGGNVVAYNYVDDAIEGDLPSWQAADIVAHCSFSYMELVEGNYAPHVALDNVHGGSGYITFFRNHHSSEHLTIEAESNQLAFGLEANALYHNAVGNVLMTEGLPAARFEDECRLGAGKSVYQFGFNDNGDHCAIDPRVRETVLLHGNFDHVSNRVDWVDGLSRELPKSLYLTEKPPFFGDEIWPYVDTERSPKVGTLPAQVRFEKLQRAK